MNKADTQKKLNLTDSFTLEEALHFMRHTPWFWYHSGASYINSQDAPRIQARLQENLEKSSAFNCRIYTLCGNLGWVGIDKYDYTEFDYTLKELLEGHPERYFIPRISMNPPEEWMRAHPEELCVYWNGPTDPEEIAAMVGTPQQDMMGCDDDSKPYPDHKIAQQSFSSLIWKEDASKALAALIEHVENGPYGKQVLGYMPTFGNCGECSWWGAWRNQGDPRKGDFGIHHKQLFFDWAVEKYGSLEALRKAWNMPDLTRENIPMPTPPERWSENGKDLKDVLLVRDQRQLDCNRFHTERTFEALETFGKVIKEKTGKPAGGFYLYFQDETAGYTGHLAIDEALASPYLDFYASPAAYHYRRAGDPGSSQGPAQSVSRKKLWIEENDMRSFMSSDWMRRPANAKETKTVFWREMYRALTFQYGFWWMDLGGLNDDWFSPDNVMMDLLPVLSAFYRRWSNVPRNPQAEVLFVDDEQSNMNITYLSGPHRSLRMRLERELRLCGTPVDRFRVDDMLDMDLSRYKFIVFCHGFVMPKEKWEKIRARIRPDAHVLWNYAAGLLDPVFNPENQKQVTGFYTAESPDRMQPAELYRHIYWHMTCKIPQDYPLLEILPEAGQAVLQTSPDHKILTAKVPRDKGANILAVDFTLRENHLRKMLQDAGVRFYAPENCTVLADDKLIGFFPRWDVEFPYTFRGAWRNAVTGETVTGAVTLSIREKEFAVFEKITD